MLCLLPLAFFELWFVLTFAVPSCEFLTRFSFRLALLSRFTALPISCYDNRVFLLACTLCQCWRVSVSFPAVIPVFVFSDPSGVSVVWKSPRRACARTYGCPSAALVKRAQHVNSDERKCLCTAGTPVPCREVAGSQFQR